MLYDLHAWFAWFVVIGNGLAGLWALAAHWAVGLRSRALWWFVAASQIAIFVQVGTGVGLVAGQGFEVDQFHMFYGFVSLLAVGLIYSYRQQMEPQRFLLYGGGGFFLMGMAIRSMILG